MFADSTIKKNVQQISAVHVGTSCCTLSRAWHPQFPAQHRSVPTTDSWRVGGRRSDAWAFTAVKHLCRYGWALCFRQPLLSCCLLSWPPRKWFINERHKPRLFSPYSFYCFIDGRSLVCLGTCALRFTVLGARTGLITCAWGILLLDERAGLGFHRNSFIQNGLGGPHGLIGFGWDHCSCLLGFSNICLAFFEKKQKDKSRVGDFAIYLWL